MDKDELAEAETRATESGFDFLNGCRLKLDGPAGAEDQAGSQIDRAGNGPGWGAEGTYGFADPDQAARWCEFIASSQRSSSTRCRSERPTPTIAHNGGGGCRLPPGLFDRQRRLTGEGEIDGLRRRAWATFGCAGRLG